MKIETTGNQIIITLDKTMEHPLCAFSDAPDTPRDRLKSFLYSLGERIRFIIATAETIGYDGDNYSLTLSDLKELRGLVSHPYFRIYITGETEI